MMLSRFDYVVVPPLTGDVENDVRALLTANGKPKTLEHILNVADMNARIAEMHGLDRDKCVKAALIHDISAVIKPADMLEYVRESGMELCEAEERYPFLLHQRMSEIVAREHFGIADAQILSPVACHTTLNAAPDEYDMALFIADKLAWDQEGMPPFYDEVYSLLSDLPAACLAYMNYMQNSGKLLCPHTNWKLAYASLSGR